MSPKPSSRRSLLIASLLAAGCSPKDPVWDMPCSERPTQEVEVGTGELEFRPADSGLHIEDGPQGGQHIWIALRLHGFGPGAAAHYGIYDADDPDILYSGPISQRLALTYNSEAEASEATGLYGYLNYLLDPATQQPYPGPSGKDVVLWADVYDQCTDTVVHGEGKGQVR